MSNNPRVHGSGTRVEHGSEIATGTRTRPHPRVQTRGCTRDPCPSLNIPQLCQNIRVKVLLARGCATNVELERRALTAGRYSGLDLVQKESCVETHEHLDEKMVQAGNETGCRVGCPEESSKEMEIMLVPCEDLRRCGRSFPDFSDAQNAQTGQREICDDFVEHAAAVEGVTLIIECQAERADVGDDWLERMGKHRGHRDVPEPKDAVAHAVGHEGQTVLRLVEDLVQLDPGE
ncbi:hypothetical protein C8J57DRAFT_1223626 [Mycena rebaudengoi]|nr:hypothetical protein C8J57DRAFT_1223626 [Mycena rebaudengoi]